jgi:hypothetical protein
MASLAFFSQMSGTGFLSGNCFSAQAVVQYLHNVGKDYVARRLHCSGAVSPNNAATDRKIPAVLSFLLLAAKDNLLVGFLFLQRCSVG